MTCTGGNAFYILPINERATNLCVPYDLILIYVQWTEGKGLEEIRSSVNGLD